MDEKKMNPVDKALKESETLERSLWNAIWREGGMEAVRKIEKEIQRLTRRGK